MDDNTTTSSPVEYAELGYPVFPCKPGLKHPATPNGVKDASRDADLVPLLWGDGCQHNVAIRTDGLLVLDVDPGGEQWLTPERELDLSVAPTCETPRGGRHYYFRQPKPPGPWTRNTAGKIAPGVDTRADGGYVLAPPSRTADGEYCWLTPLDVTPDQLPEPPAWLLSALNRQDAPMSASDEDFESIPSGQRNATLTSVGGRLRRDGHTKREIHALLSQANKDRCNPPLPAEEVSRIAQSVSRYERDYDVSDDYHADHIVRLIELPVPKFTLAELREHYPDLNPPVVDGLFRAGETVNLISTSKVGKSWLAYNLALSIITGEPWLGFPTAKGRVLLIDNELHRNTLAHRIPTVGDALGLQRREYEQDIEIWPLRGDLRSLPELGPWIDAIEPGGFRAIIMDAKYRFATRGRSENDNASEALVYNLLDQYAEKTGAAIVLVHHTSKGNQSEKRVTDVGAGAGAQSRACDTHLVLREHEEPGCVVLDAAVRSFPPVDPLVLRWAFPLWQPAVEMDPARLKLEKNRAESKQERKDADGRRKVTKIIRDAGKPLSRHTIRRGGFSNDRLNRLVAQLVDAGDIKVIEGRGGNGKATEFLTLADYDGSDDPEYPPGLDT